MALNIPMPELPLSGLNQAISTGGNLFSQMMHPVLQRENMGRQWKEHLDNQALQKEQMANAMRNDDLKRELMQQQLVHAKNVDNPDYEFNRFKKFMGLSTEEMKNNPMMRGFIKHQFGFDPFEPTSQQKQNDALNLFREKEKIKNESKSGNSPTNTVLTQNQQAVQAIDTVSPMIDEFINNPEKVYGITDFSRGKKAAYNAKTSGMIDTLVAAQSLPKVQASIDLVEEQIRRRTGETTNEYIERLKDLKKDLSNRRSKAARVVEYKKVNTELPHDLSNMSDEELQRIASGAK